jgi:DNA mismatch repair ATPase MutS
LRPKDPIALYQEKINKTTSLQKKLRKKDIFYSFLKLILVFLAFFQLIIVFPKDHKLSIAIFSVLVLIFILFAIIHENILKKMKLNETIKEINENEIKLQSHQFSEIFDNGKEFEDPDHDYTKDMDIFGERSIFHYVNRAVTSIGRENLANRLKQPAEIKTIPGKQEAVKELANKLDFRQKIQAHGFDIDDTSKKLKNFYFLFEEESFLLPKKKFIFAMHAIVVITILAFLLISIKIPLYVPLGLVFLQLMINKITGRKVSQIYSATAKHYKILKTYSKIIWEIENETFECAILNQLKETLSTDKGSASTSIKKLSNLMECFEIKGSGMLYALVNNILLWDLHCIKWIEKWKEEHAAKIHLWFNVIGELETISSLANLYFNNPSWTLPKIIETGFRLKAMALGHPLIPKIERITNDIDIDKEGRILIITGPNMAGKSTFLRTIGVNSVLALAGAPVCASDFEISYFELVTSMLSSDSLDKQLSLFYAELQRLKKILDRMDQKIPFLFIIDEMLKGTNALDRQKGSIELIKQLIRNNSTGIIATHDLELSHLNRLKPGGGKIKNYHFDGYVKKDKLLFDYKLKKGICRSFNALELMKRIGIEI